MTSAGFSPAGPQYLPPFFHAAPGNYIDRGHRFQLAEKLKITHVGTGTKAFNQCSTGESLQFSRYSSAPDMVVALWLSGLVLGAEFFVEDGE
jgi:hypothetical protein